MRVALIGTAPSIRLAPYHDKTWTIWGCSPGAYPVVERHDAWFELHRWEPPVVGRPDQQVPWFSPEYCQWLGQQTGPVYMAEALADVPASIAYPFAAMVEKYGPYFFTSSLSWMLALALEQPGITEIGLFGVEMSASEEYALQRPGCHYFLTLAAQRGIKVTVPPESDLLQPPTPYGVCELSPRHIRLLARKKEIEQKLAANQHKSAQLQDETMFLRGALEDCNYVLNTWLTDTQWVRQKNEAPC